MTEIISHALLPPSSNPAYAHLTISAVALCNWLLPLPFTHADLTQLHIRFCWSCRDIVDKGVAGRWERRRGRSVAAKCMYHMKKPDFRHSTSFKFFNQERKLIKYRVLVSPWPDQEGNKLQRQKILSFVYPIYNHNWRNISNIYIYIYIYIKQD